MRARCGVALVGAAAVATFALGGGTAYAKATLQGQLGASIGYTDNVLNAPATASPVGDGFAEIRPSLILSAGTPRAIQRLSYTLTGNLYFTRTEANSYTNRLEWAGLFLPSPRSDLQLLASLSQGKMNTFNFGQVNEVTPGAVRVTGGATFVAAALREALTYELAPVWRLTQGIAFGSLFVVDQPRTTSNTVTLDGTVGADRVFRSDSVGLELRLGYLAFLDPDTTDPTTGMTIAGATRHGMLNALTARWRHDFGRAWTVEAQLGVVEANRLQSGANVVWQPYALAAARIGNAWATGELSYTHTVTPSALAGSIFTVDALSLRGTFLLGQRTGLVFTTGAGYQYARQAAFDTGVETATAHIGLVDGALTWAATRELSVFARYTYFIQKPDGMPTTTATGLPDLSRHTILVGLAAIYPADPGVPRAPDRPPSRVDRTDSEGIPAPHRRDDDRARQ
jgi:hypothetical protein